MLGASWFSTLLTHIIKAYPLEDEKICFLEGGGNIQTEEILWIYRALLLPRSLYLHHVFAIRTIGESLLGQGMMGTRWSFRKNQESWKEREARSGHGILFWA